MTFIRKTSVLLFLTLAFTGMQLSGTDVFAYSSYFSSNCAGCHASPVTTSCNGCHHHGARNLKGTTDKTSYTPGETVSVTISGGSQSGWIRAILYDQNNQQVAISGGNASGMGHSTTFPAVLTAPAPTTPGTYTWKAAWYGNSFDTNNMNASSHAEEAVSTNSFTVTAPADTTAPVVGTFTLPATSTSLSVQVSALSATDNVAVTGYLITTSSSKPAASASGWSTAAPSSVTAVEGSNTFYAWAKDAAGNVSTAKSATVTVTLPDTSAPVIGTFTLPTTSTSLSVQVSALSATDNVAVTGYLITTSSSKPAASASGWSTAVPSSVTAVEGSNTFYAWAKDAAGNVSAAKSATVTVTLPDTTAPVVGSFALPATSDSLTVAISALSATDNVGVTGYMITTTSAQPAASASGWSTAVLSSVTAVEGSNTFYAWAKDAAGNVSAAKTATVTVTLVASSPPALSVSTLADGAYTNQATINVSGTATDADGIQSLTVNGQDVTVNNDGTFSVAVTLVEGPNTITVVATDTTGSQQSDTRTVTYDPAAPVITVTSPADNSSTTDALVIVSGNVNETSSVFIKVNNDSPVAANMTNNDFTATVGLAAGVNNIEIDATDLAGNTSSAKRTVTYNVAQMTLAITDPAQDLTINASSLVLQGTVAALGGDVTVTITMDGQTYTPVVQDGVFQQELTFSTAQQYAIAVTATDATGNTSTVYRNVIYQPAQQGDDHEDEESDHDYRDRYQRDDYHRSDRYEGRYWHYND